MDTHFFVLALCYFPSSFHFGFASFHFLGLCYFTSSFRFGFASFHFFFSKKKERPKRGRILRKKRKKKEKKNAITVRELVENSTRFHQNLRFSSNQRATLSTWFWTGKRKYLSVNYIIKDMSPVATRKSNEF